MTRQEARERYGIPEKILAEYESWGLGSAGGRQYDDGDMERLSLMLTLHDIGFEPEAVKSYMRLALEGDRTGARRMLMLGERRRGMLDEIHLREKQLDQLDYLRYTLRKDPSAKL